MIVLILLLTSGMIQAMDWELLSMDYSEISKPPRIGREYEPLLMDDISHKLVKDIQYTTEISDPDAVTFDSENPCHLFIGTHEGIVLYDAKKHSQGKCKELPSCDIYSLRSAQVSNNNLLAYSTKKNLSILNRTLNIADSVRSKKNIKIRLFAKTMKLAAFRKNKIDICDIQSFDKGPFYSLTNKTEFKGLEPSLSGEQFITWTKDDYTVAFWDMRLLKPFFTLSKNISSIASDHTKVAMGTPSGDVLLFDQRKLKEPLLDKRLMGYKKVSVEYTEPSKKFVAACGDQIAVIDVDNNDLETIYHLQGKEKWVTNPAWQGCKYNGQNMVAVNWHAICDQEPESGDKKVISLINLQKAHKVNNKTILTNLWQKIFKKK